MKAIVLSLLIVSSAAIAKIEGSGIKTILDIQKAFANPTANTSFGSNCLTSVSSLTGISAGKSVYDLTTPSNLPGQDDGSLTVVAVPGTCSAGQVQISAPAAGNGTGDSIGIGGPLTNLPLTAQVFDSFNAMPLSKSISTGAIGGAGGATNVLGSKASPLNVTAGGGVVLSSQTTRGPNLAFVQGNGGSVTVTATPSVTACSGVGELLILFGGSNPLTLQDNMILVGSNLTMGRNMTLAPGASIMYMCDAISGLWQEISRHESFVVATGGTITTDGNFKIHTFTGSGTFTVTSGNTSSAEVLVIAAGGGGGSNSGGGGGAGGAKDFTGVSLGIGSYTVTIGTHGVGGTLNGNGTAGGNSIFQGLTTMLGGGGGEGDANTNQCQSGGSGGAPHFNDNCTGAGTGGQGFSSGSPGSHYVACDGGMDSGAGGGGATSAGQGGCGTAPVSLQGGTGLTSSISGSSVCYAGGGNGGYNAGTQAAAQCGGGIGTANGGGPGGNATNYGGGGGGSGTNNVPGGDAFDGVVIVRYQFQ